MKWLRRATRADLPAIQAVLASDPVTWASLEGGPLRADEAEHLLAEQPPGVSEDRHFVYVLDGVCVIDLVQGFPNPSTWYLGLIFLAPEARGAGLGTKFLEVIAERVRRGGGTALRLAVVVENVAARRLYDRLGFQLVARRPRGKQEVDVLERPLPAKPVAGFYVLPNCCMSCAVPESHAPALFSFVPDTPDCHMIRQPRTDDELEQMMRVLAAQEVDCIRYCGDAPEVLTRIRKYDLARYVD